MFRVKEERNRRAHIALLDFENRINCMRLGFQAQYEELRQCNEQGETCPNCGVKRMRVRTQPYQPFWEAVGDVPSGSGGSQLDQSVWEVLRNALRPDGRQQYSQQEEI